MSSPPSHSPEMEWHTPQTARIKTLRDDASLSFGRISKITGIPKSSVFDKYHETITYDSSRRKSHNPDWEETRGRPSKISLEDIRTMEQILESDRVETRGLSWQQLGYEAGLDIHGDTVRAAMGTMDYHKYIACRKG